MAEDRFDGFSVELYRDEEGDWLAHFAELPTVSAFGDSPELALKELENAWRVVKEDYQAEGKDKLGKYLRVVTLADHRTIHNAFPDRRFQP